VIDTYLYVLAEDLGGFTDVISNVKDYVSLRIVAKKEFETKLAIDLLTSKDPANVTFAVCISKNEYFKSDTKFSIMQSTIARGIQAEPIFIVVADSFSDKERYEIISHNDSILFVPLASYEQPEKDGLGTAYLLSVVHKAAHDFETNRKMIIQMKDSFLSFIEAEKYNEEKTEIEKLNNELIVENKIDTLTRIFNRKGILIEYEIAQSRTRREKRYIESGSLNDHIGRLSCMLIDLDDFKKVNDTYGHLIGDMVLQRVAALFQDKSIFRLEDICGRYGGEEFVVIYPNTNAQHAKIPAERFRRHLREIEFASREGHLFHVTSSIGIAELPYIAQYSKDSLQDLADLEVLIHRADQAMYQAKKLGKDQVVVFDDI
jgi:diguanylate cyclase (GGDEF)-like protein